MRHLRHFAFAACFGAISVACDGGGPGISEAITLDITSPNGAEGAALIRLIGSIDTAETDLPGWLLTERSGDTTWVFIGLRDPGDVSLRVRRPDHAGELETALLQVSGPDDALRNLTGYALEVR